MPRFDSMPRLDPMPHAVRAAFAFVLAAPAACGASSPREVDGAFGAIQIEEARLEHAAALETDPLACARMREAAATICRIAEALDDADALARCGRARRRSAAAPCSQHAP